MTFTEKAELLDGIVRLIESMPEQLCDSEKEVEIVKTKLTEAKLWMVEHLAEDEKNLNMLEKYVSGFGTTE
jgi:hypothetical protein